MLLRSCVHVVMRSIALPHSWSDVPPGRVVGLVDLVRPPRSAARKTNDDRTRLSDSRPFSGEPMHGHRLVSCLLYTSDAADDLLCVDLGGRRIIKKKKKQKNIKTE